MDFIRKCLTKEKYLRTTTVKGPNQLMYILGFTTIPFFLCLVVFFVIFKQLVKVSLYLYHGRKFKGFLTDTDLYWANETQGSKSIVAYIWFIKTEKKNDVIDGIRKRMKERIFDRPNDYPKLTSTKHKFLGYTYLLPNNYTLKDVVRVLDVDSKKEVITEEEYNKFVNNYAFGPFPKDNTGLWEIVLSQHLIATKNENEYLYPILVRIHHLVGDGASMVAYNIKVWADKTLDITLQKIASSKAEKNSKEEHFFTVCFQAMVRFAKIISHVFYLIYVWMGFIYWFQYVREKDFNALHGPKLTGEKHVAWYNESKVELVPLIKNIKNSVGNTRFSDVLYTSMIASFKDYFKKYSYPMPETFTIGQALTYASNNFNNSGPAVLENNTCFVFFSVPAQTSSLLTSLQKISELNEEVLRSPAVEVNLFTLKYLIGMFPEPLLNLLTYVKGVTAMAINLPGAGKSTMLEGLEIENTTSFALNRCKIGVSLNFLTYDDRMQMSIVVDKVLIKKQEDVDGILEDIMKNLHLLNEEVTAKLGKKTLEQHIH